MHATEPGASTYTPEGFLIGRHRYKDKKSTLPTVLASLNSCKNLLVMNILINNMQTLAEASKVSKKSARALQQNYTSSLKSSSNCSTPKKFSNFYNEQIDPHSPLLKESLNSDNYKEKFHQLLCWEEQEHEKELTQRYRLLFHIATNIFLSIM